MTRALLFLCGSILWVMTTSWTDRNILEIVINLDNEVLFESELTEIDSISRKIIYHLKSDNPGFPTRETIYIDGIGKVKSSLAVFHLRVSNQTCYGSYIQVQDEIESGINQLRNEASIKHFGLKLSELSDLQLEKICLIYPLRIYENDEIFEFFK